MKHYSVKFKTGGYMVKAIVVAGNILKARRMMEAMYPEAIDGCERPASIRLLHYR